MRLITGPPRSGKTQRMLAEFAESLKAGDGAARLLVPTATLAEHLRNRLARAGVPVQPASVTTLGKFVEPFVADFDALTRPDIEIALDRILRARPPRAFEAVAHTAGFRRTLARLVDEFAGAGATAGELAELLREMPGVTAQMDAFGEVYEALERDLRTRGLMRGPRLLAAALAIAHEGLGGVDALFLDGFFVLSDPERHVLDAMKRHAKVTLTACETNPDMRSLLDEPHEIVRATEPPPAPRIVCVPAASVEREIDEIVRRVHEHVAEGGAYSDIGIVVRTELPYVPLLQSALGRMDIPHRAYFSKPLAAEPLIQFCVAVIEAFESGWDYERLLVLARLERRDEVEVSLSRKIPGSGLLGLGYTGGRFRILENWRDSTPQVWVQRLATLPRLFEASANFAPSTHEAAIAWRTRVRAAAAWEQALADAARTFDASRAIPLAEFWPAVRIALDEASLRVPDNRRNVVHILDAPEARLWQLPVVFLCGLIEGSFPRQIQPEAIFSDVAREHLRHAEINIRTTDERRQSEAFLLEMALSRATETLVLSWPSTDALGEETAPAFFLDRFSDANAETPIAMRRRPQGEAKPVVPPHLSEAALPRIAGIHPNWSPSRIESYLQCPFQFFARHTLKLRDVWQPVKDRLNPLLLGSVVHEVLRKWAEGDARPMEQVLDEVLASECARRNIPAGAAVEMERLNLLRALNLFTQPQAGREGWKMFLEQGFSLRLTADVEVRGRIDRVDVAPDGRAAAMDYKYSTAERLTGRFRTDRPRQHIQDGVYLLAIEAMGYQPISFEYIPLKGGGVPLGLYDPEALRGRVDHARQLVIEAASSVSRGVIAADPKDRRECEYCDFRHACRYVKAAADAEGAA